MIFSIKEPISFTGTMATVLTRFGLFESELKYFIGIIRALVMLENKLGNF